MRLTLGAKGFSFEDQYLLDMCERLGMIENTGEYFENGDPIYRATAFGRTFWYAHPNTRDFCEAFNHLVLVDEYQLAAGKGLKH